jgi:hypothetical protein
MMKGKEAAPKGQTRAERKQLDAFDCDECTRYYQSLGLSEEQIRAKMSVCSRHRNALEAEKTNDEYWDLDFPSTPEIKRRNLTKNCVSKSPIEPKPKS